MYEGADTVILYEELAFSDVVPLAWHPLKKPLELEEQGQLADRNLRMLLAYTALEEHGQVEKADDNSPHAADILRLDMKMNLLLDLVGRLLLVSQPRPKASHIKFNAMGALVRLDVPALELGDEGILDIYLKDFLVEPLRLIGRIAHTAPDGRYKIKFTHPGEAIANLIEKLTFRRHRRQIADAKKPSTGDTARIDASRFQKPRR
jgi:hypothetical protein